MRHVEELRSVKDDYIAGASASLSKTIAVIMKILEDERKRPTRRLRAFLHEKLGDFAVMWYRKGFNRGHKESDRQCEDGSVPRSLRYDATREFFTDDERTVHLKSKLKRKRGRR
jgi:hypothetical protein